MPFEPGSWSIALDQGTDAPRIARDALGAWLADVPEHVRDNALIAVAELVANAVRSGRSPIHVRASVGAEALVVEVSDEGESRPRRRVPADDGGVGLNLVYLLADRVEIETGRTRVRCTFGTTIDRPAGPPDPDHRVALVRQGTTVLVALEGDIDLAARPELDQLLATLDPAHLERVVIDLRDVTFLDSTGLHMAQRFDRWGRDNDVTVVFTRGIPAVMLALRSTGLADRLTFSDAP